MRPQPYAKNVRYRGLLEMGEGAFPREKYTNWLSIGQKVSPENIHAGRTIWSG